MSQFVWYRPLDGFGRLAIDLHECRWLTLTAYAFDGENYGLDYYMHRSETGQIRWIRCQEDEEFIEDADGGRLELCQSYSEDDPRTAAHEFLSAKKRLPPELEEFREFGDFERYHRWQREDMHKRYLAQQQSDGSNQQVQAPKSKPTWNRDTLTLSVDGVVCRKFRRLKGNDQITILEAFESSGWPETIKDPFEDELKLRETAKSFNRSSHKSLKSETVFRLVPGRRKVAWSSGRSGVENPNSPLTPR